MMVFPHCDDQGALVRFVVDGLETENPDSAYLGDGAFPPFVLFDIEEQDNRPGEYQTRAEAQSVADALNERWRNKAHFEIAVMFRVYDRSEEEAERGLAAILEQATSSDPDTFQYFEIGEVKETHET